MNTINCRVKLGDGWTDVAGVGVTPAEAIVLRTIHDPASAADAAGNPAGNGIWNVIVNPVAAGEVQRSGQEEVARLRRKYAVLAASKKHRSHITEDLFPGLNPALPQTFEEIGLAVASPAEPPVGKPPPPTEADLKEEIHELKEQIAKAKAKPRRGRKTEDIEPEEA